MTKLKDTRARIKAGPKDGLQEGQFSAYASVFGNKDSYGDIVMPGAFADTLKEWDESGLKIPLLFGHNMQDPDFNIGDAKAVEDDHGLLITGTLALGEPKADQVYRLIKGGRINQMSFAYDVLDGGEGQREKEDGTKEWFYELRRLKLYEVSVVPIGANQETEILAVKAAAAASQMAAGGPLSEELKASLLPVHEALGTLLFGSKTQDADTGTGEPPKGEDPPADNPTKATPAVPVERLAAELTLLSLGRA